MYPSTSSDAIITPITYKSILFEINTFPGGSKNHEYGKAVYKLFQIPFLCQMFIL